MTPALPWRRPRHELALLALVALAVLSPVHAIGAQDTTRLCLTGALEHAHLSADSCLAWALDKSQHGRHLYSDKAPGLSLLAVPAAEAVRLDSEHLDDARVWAVRLLTSGIAFLVLAFLVGRVGEGLAPGCGGATLVACSLGTLVAPFAATSFSHVPAASLGFAAFVLAWSRRHALAGLAAGGAVLVEYQAAAIVLVLAVYVAFRGLRRVGAYALGVVPGVALLLAYDTLAFGAPWHLSYRYIANGYVFFQNRGVFGVDTPSAYGTYQLLAGAGGLLVISPVLVAAVWGLVLLGRTYPREALVCAAVTLVFAAIEIGYFLPYGGISPGPRFFVPALPFLALGVAAAFRRAPAATSVLAVLSVVPTVALTLVWSTSPHLHRTVWWELARVVGHGEHSRLVTGLTGNALGWVGAGRIAAAAVVALAAAAAVVLGLPGLPRVRHARSRGAVFAAAASVAAVAVADASALAEYPYTTRSVPPPPLLFTTLGASKTDALPGDEVDFTATVENPQPTDAGDAVLHVALSPGLRLLGAPAVERGPGCAGTSELACNLEFMPARQTTAVRFGVRVLPGAAAEQTVTAWSSAEGFTRGRPRVTIRTGSS